MARLYGKIKIDIQLGKAVESVFSSQSLTLEGLYPLKASTFLTLISALSSSITSIQQTL